MSPTAARQDFARLLSDVRRQSGKTLRELQAVTYVSDSALSRYLSGANVPAWNVVAAICDQAGTEPDELRRPWQLARASRRTSTPDTDQTLGELHEVATTHLHHLAEAVTRSIHAVQARGEQVPDTLLALKHHSAAAIHQLQAAAQSLADSECPAITQPETTDRSASTDGGTKK